jgi:hypothetical protein
MGGAAPALTLPAKRGIAVSAETIARWLYKIGWVWKRPTLVATDDDPHRITRLAGLQWVFEPLKVDEPMVGADALDIQLLPTVGCAWMPRGTQPAVMTPGQNQQHHVAGALDLSTGTLHHYLGPRTTNALCRDLLSQLDARDPTERYMRLSVVVDHYSIHQAKAVAPWLAAHPWLIRLWPPTYGPRANRIERAFGEVHDGRTRHQRKHLPDLVVDVEDHVPLNGPWKYQLSGLYNEPAVTAAVVRIAAEEHAAAAA